MHQDEMFLYLDELRDSGRINMYGAGPELEREYGLEASAAREVLQEWMDTYSDRHTVK